MQEQGPHLFLFEAELYHLDVVDEAAAAADLDDLFHFGDRLHFVAFLLATKM